MLQIQYKISHVPRVIHVAFVSISVKQTHAMSCSRVKRPLFIHAECDVSSEFPFQYRMWRFLLPVLKGKVLINTDDCLIKQGSFWGKI